MSSTREAIVTAAAELLDQAGPEAVTLRGVALKVGVSHNAPYKHFRDKEALLAAVAARELLARSAAVEAALAPGADALAELKKMAKGYVLWAQRYPARFKLTFGGWSRHDEELGRAAEGARAMFIAAVAAAQATDAVPAGDPERVAALIQALGHGAADLALSGHLSREGKGHADPEDLVDDLFALLLAAAQPSTPP